MKSVKCRVCGETIFSTDDNFDVLHTCREFDGSEMKTRTEWDKIPGRSNKRIDEHNWTSLANNPYPYKRKWSDQKKALYDEVTVKRVVEV